MMIGSHRRQADEAQLDAAPSGKVRRIGEPSFSYHLPLEQSLNSTQVSRELAAVGSSSTIIPPQECRQQKRQEPFGQTQQQQQQHMNTATSPLLSRSLLVAAPALLDEDDAQEASEGIGIPLEQRYPDYYRQQKGYGRIGVRQGAACSVLVSVVLLAGGGVLLASLVDRAAAAAIYGVGILLVLS